MTVKLNKKIHLSCIIPNPHDATSFYRAIGPLSEIQKKNKENLSLTLLTTEELSWATLAFTDILFVQRPAKPQHLTMIKAAKNAGIPVWIDYDDLLWKIPESNPSAAYYDQKDVKRLIQDAVDMADVITVSTEYLRNCFVGVFGESALAKCFVIENAYDESKLGPLEAMTKAEFIEKHQEKFKKFAWRGSKTHDQDLYLYKDLFSLTLKVKENFFYFFGHKPFYLNAKNLSLRTPNDVVEYHVCLKEVSPHFLYVPLDMVPFNYAKSNIAWLEATYAGAVTIASQTPEFKKPGLILDIDKFQPSEIEDYSISSVYEYYERSVEEIQRKYLLKETNLLRTELLNKYYEIMAQLSLRDIYDLNEALKFQEKFLKHISEVYFLTAGKCVHEVFSKEPDFSHVYDQSKLPTIRSKGEGI